MRSVLLRCVFWVGQPKRSTTPTAQIHRHDKREHPNSKDRAFLFPSHQQRREAGTSEKGKGRGSLPKPLSMVKLIQKKIVLVERPCVSPVPDPWRRKNDTWASWASAVKGQGLCLLRGASHELNEWIFWVPSPQLLTLARIANRPHSDTVVGPSNKGLYFYYYKSQKYVHTDPRKINPKTCAAKKVASKI